MIKRRLKALSLCDGVSMGLEALKRTLPDYEIEYHAVEISAKKRFLSDTNHSGIIRPYNDVYDMLDKDLGHYDLLLAGPTCTSLSSQGPRTEWDGESKIFFSCDEIRRKLLATNPDLKFLFENVASMRNVVRDEISQHLGVNHWLGESELVSAQDRKRYYWFNWEAPTLVDRGITADSILDEDGLCLVAFSKSNRNKKGEKAIVEGRIKAKAKSNTLTTGKNCDGQSTINRVFTKQMKVRGLTVAECARLQGVDNYCFDFVSDAEAFHAIGDGWSLPVIVEILKMEF